MKHLILGTDWYSDCDDCVAVRLLVNLHKAKQISLDGIAINACMEYSAASLCGFLEKSGVTDIPIALDCEATNFAGTGRYQKRLAQYATKIKSNDEAEEPIKLYRKVLASADKNVDVLEIGFNQILAGLLKSNGDEISPLKGIDLVREKVEHLWIVGGQWDIPTGGKEHNFCNTLKASKSIEYVCENWPTPITFLGFEVGDTVITGNKLDHNDPLHQAIIDTGHKNGRSSWDPMLVLLGAVGNLEQEGYTSVTGTARVDGDTGINYFTETPNGNHRYVKKTRSDEFYENRINELINL